LRYRCDWSAPTVRPWVNIERNHSLLVAVAWNTLCFELANFCQLRVLIFPFAALGRCDCVHYKLAHTRLAIRPNHLTQHARPLLFAVVTALRFEVIECDRVPSHDLAANVE